MAGSNFDAVDINVLLINNYKKIGLNEIEALTLLVVYQLISEKNKFITADLLALKMTISQKEIDDVLVSLLKRGYIEYKTKNKELVTSIKPTKEKLIKELKNSILEETELKENKVKANELKLIVASFETLFNRRLTPIEYNKLCEWVYIGYTSELISDAFKEVIKKNKKTIREVEKVLLTWQTRDDIAKEGFSAINDKWDKDIEESIKIANVKWVKNSND